MKLLVLSRTEVAKSVTMEQAIETVKAAFGQLSRQRAHVPVRTQLGVPRHDGVVLFMPAYLEGTDELGMKIVSVFSGNLELGLPTIHAMVTLLDPETGRPTAILDGSYLTALRTGAASGAATDLLARTRASTVAVLGTGAQGRTQLAGVCAVRPIERVLVFDPRAAASAAFRDEMSSELGIAIEAVDEAAKAVRGADIVCTATTSNRPVFRHEALAPGTHVNAVGSFTPTMQELPPETVESAKLVVDSREAVWAETGDLIIPRREGRISEDTVHAEIGEIVNGTRPARENDEEITLFKSVGNAVQDVSVASRIYTEARKLGLGTEVEL